MTVTDLIVSGANANSIDPALAIEVATAESGLNQNAIGAAGEVGVFQLLPSSFPGVNIADLQTNINAGVGYLASLLAQFGDPVAAVAAYNAGPTAVRRAIAQYGVGNCPGGYPAWLQGVPGSTQRYVERIFGALSYYTVCVAGVPIPVSPGSAPGPSGSPPSAYPSITAAGVPSTAPPGWAIALAIAGLGFLLFLF